MRSARARCVTPARPVAAPQTAVSASGEIGPCRPRRSRAPRPAGSRWPRRGSATRGTPCRRCGRFAAPWPAPACCRSTRSTCCSGPTTCRCSPGWVPTTPACSRRAVGAASRAGWWSTGPTSRPSCRSTCGRVMQHRMRALPRPAGTSGGACRSGRSWSTSLLAEIAERGASTAPRPRRRAAPRQGALGLELVGHQEGARVPLHGRRARRRRPQQPVRAPSTTCPSG